MDKPHLPQFVDILWRICGKPSRASREVVVKFNNFTPNNSPSSQIVEKSSLKESSIYFFEEKKAKPIPEDFNPPREISAGAWTRSRESGDRVQGLGIIQGQPMQIGKPVIGTHVADGWV